MGDFSSWYYSIPLITRYWFTGSTVVPLFGRLQFFNVNTMMLDYELTVTKLQLWRLITALFYYPVTPSNGFHWLIMCYFLYTYSKNLESSFFDGLSADYFFMLFFCWVSCTIVCLAADIPFLLEPMVLSVLYVWCQFNKNQTVSFWFGMQFKAIYLPWVLVAFNTILRGRGMNEIIGILVGHFYYFLAYQYAQDFNGSVLIKTPQFLYKYFPSRLGNNRSFGNVPQNRRISSETRGRHAWGQGRTLGGQ